MRIHVYACIYVYAYTYICIHIYIYIYVYTCITTHNVYTYAYACVMLAIFEVKDSRLPGVKFWGSRHVGVERHLLRREFCDRTDTVQQVDLSERAVYSIGQ